MSANLPSNTKEFTEPEVSGQDGESRKDAIHALKTAGTQVTARLQTLGDAYQAWLEAPHARQPDSRNRDRSKSDLGNHARALKCLSLGSKGNGNLAGTPADALFQSAEAIGARVREGAAIEAAERQWPAPNPKVVQNLAAHARAIATFAQKEQGTVKAFRSGGQKHAARQRRRTRKGFSLSEWPESLLSEFKQYAQWHTRPILSEAQGANFRGPAAVEYTLQCRRIGLGPYLSWRREHKLPMEHLTDLMVVDDYADFLNDYLREAASEQLGGHSSAHQTAVSLGVIAKYLVAVGRFDPPGIEGESDPGRRLVAAKAFAQRFYNLGKQALAQGAADNTLRRNHRVEGWTAKDLISIGEEAFCSPRRIAGRAPKPIDTFARRRTGLFFILAAETPMRARNWREMRWDTNLTRLPDGRWRVRFAGKELKIKTREKGKRANVYQQEYSRQASARIDEWREYLAQVLGPDFERTVPWVLPTITPRRPAPTRITDRSFGHNILLTGLELRDTHFCPHQVRHIVASDIINSMGVHGLGLAAEKLGDRLETVMREYYRADTREANRAYLDKLYDR